MIDTAFTPLCRAINGRVRGYIMPTFIEQINRPLQYKHDDVKVLAFSGGKISIACALRYKAVGQKMILYHVAKTRSDVSRIQHLSEMLNLPLYVHYEDMAFNSIFFGIKILELATEYAVGHKHEPKIVFGCFDEASIQYNSQKGWSYCKEFIDAFRVFGKKCIDGYDVVSPVPNYTVMWDELLGNKPYLSYIDYKDEVEAAVFQNVRMDYYLDEPDKDLYLYNIKYLKRRENSSTVTLSDVWNKYFFYRIEKSRFYNDLMELSS